MDMVLAKSDIAIAERYAELVKDEGLREAIFPRIRPNGRPRDALLAITGQAELLDGNPLLKRSIRNRFPYLDPLNHLQVELLRRHRAARGRARAARHPPHHQRRRRGPAQQRLRNGPPAGLRCARRSRSAPRRFAVVEIVNHVDAAGEGDAAIHHGKFAMEPAQAMPPDAGLADFRAVGHHLDAGGRQRCSEARRKVARAEAIHQQAYRDTPLRGGGQRGGHKAPGPVVGKDVGFEMHLVRGCVNRGNQRGKIFGSRAQQSQAVARQEAVRTAGGKVGAHGTAILSRNPAESAAWSEMADHGGPA
jgi:hypothetical protein